MDCRQLNFTPDIYKIPDEALMRRFLYLLALLALSMTLRVAEARQIDRDMLPDEQTAKKVGGAILETYIGRQAFEKALKKAEVTVLDEDKAWVVFLYPKLLPAPKATADGVEQIIISHGLELPELHLSKHDGRVTEISFSRD
jgi:hypothetical protein